MAAIPVVQAERVIAVVVVEAVVPHATADPSENWTQLLSVSDVIE